METLFIHGGSTCLAWAEWHAQGPPYVFVHIQLQLISFFFVGPGGKLL